MSKSGSRLLTGARVSELTGLHGVTLGKLVREGFLQRDEATLRYHGTELVVAQALAYLGTRASKSGAHRDRCAVEKLREALAEGAIGPLTDLVVTQDFARLVHTLGERLDATVSLRDYRVLGVGAWLGEFKKCEPEAFGFPALIVAA
ncbi:hypothetical protein [Streptomyces violascens]|uniref:hypothetical protein n=1 Tax=Streptomyces violascens TaxID=67381 RepID=UPI003693BCF2